MSINTSPFPSKKLKRVISASKRTDIPAFYIKWFADRVREGQVTVANPLYHHKTTDVSLKPEDVSWIVFWSKNYGVFQRFAGCFDAYQLYFQFTMNPPSPFLEPDVPTEDQVIEQVRWLHERYDYIYMPDTRPQQLALFSEPDPTIQPLPLQEGHIAWRYDPITCWREGGEERSNYDPVWFERMCGKLSALGVRRCYTSFADHYAKFRARMKRHYPDIEMVDPCCEAKVAMAEELKKIATAHDITLYSCTEGPLEALLPKGSCIDGQLLNQLSGNVKGASTSAATDTKMKGREDCGCTLAIDIGNYREQECGYSCLYCYANPNHRRYAIPDQT